jgi:GrpB-like predicted nucleotidyltransferase (UPF0157 family)
MVDMPPPIVIADYDARWPDRFMRVGGQLRTCLGADAVRIDHIGSTSVPGLAAKDVIDVQITVTQLVVADEWPDELLPEVVRRDDTGDHVPTGSFEVPGEWEKRYWSRPLDLHVHVREDGRANQRYALLFRDYLRADPLAAGSYAAVKRALVASGPRDWAAYYAVKDPACDVIFAAAEQWAARTAWSPSPSDA